MSMMILKNVIALLSYDSRCRLLRELTLLRTISENSEKFSPASRLESLLIKFASLSCVSSMIRKLEKIVVLTLFAPFTLSQSSKRVPKEFKQKVSDHWTPDPFYPPHNN